MENAEDSKEFGEHAAPGTEAAVSSDTQGKSAGDAWKKRECVGEVPGYSLLPCKLEEG